MNKKILALAVGAVMGAAPMVGAQADVKIYGNFLGQIAHESNNGNRSQTVQNDNTGRGRLGFLFHEKLGNGLTSFGKLEFQVDINDSYSAGCNSVTKTSGGTKIVGEQTCMRDAFVGIKGGFGAIAAGSFHGAYKTTGGVKYDPFVTTALDARGVGGMARGRLAQNNFVRQIVQYQTPNLMGFKAQAQYSFDQSTPSTPNSGTTNGDWLAGLTYNIGHNSGVQLIGAWAHNEVTGGTNQDNWKLGAQWKGGPFTVQTQYERTETAGTLFFNGNSYNGKAKIWYVNGGYRVGNWDLFLSYADYKARDNSNYDTKFYRAGTWYHFSKKTSAYIGYRKSNINVGQSQGVYGTGLRVDF